MFIDWDLMLQCYKHDDYGSSYSSEEAYVDTSPTVAEINAKYAEINLMRYISQTTKKNPSVFFGSIKQF